MGDIVAIKKRKRGGGAIDIMACGGWTGDGTMRQEFARVGLAALALVLTVGGTEARELRIHTWASYLAPELVSKFERETGVSVRIDTVTNYVDMLTPLETGHSGYDITFPADYHIKDLAARGLLEKIAADSLANFWHVEQNWRSRAFDPRNEYSVPHVWGTTGFVVDTALYKGDINTLRLLFDPPTDLKGRISLMDAGYDMVQMALVFLGQPRCSVQPDTLAKAEALLLPMLQRYAVPTIDGIVEAMVDTNNVLVVAWNGDALKARLKRPTLRYAYPREGNLVWSDVMSVPKGAPNKADALRFLSFMMKPENAAAESNYNGYANMIRGSEAHMDKVLVTAPEIITPISSSSSFYSYCENSSERLQEVFWKGLKKKAGKP